MSTSCPLGIAFAVRPSAVGVQLHPAVLILYEAFRPQHMAARGVGEEGRDILFELLAREAQLQKVGRTKGPTLVEVELFAAGLTAAAAVDGGKVLAAARSRLVMLFTFMRFLTSPIHSGVTVVRFILSPRLRTIVHVFPPKNIAKPYKMV